MQLRKLRDEAETRSKAVQKERAGLESRAAKAKQRLRTRRGGPSEQGRLNAVLKTTASRLKEVAVRPFRPHLGFFSFLC